MNKSRLHAVSLRTLFAPLCISLFCMWGGVNCPLYGQITPCSTPPDDCMLLCNPNFGPPSPCVVNPSALSFYDGMAWVEPFSDDPLVVECENFEGWLNIYGTPDYSNINATPTDNTQMRIWATHSAIGTPPECCQRGEGIMAAVNIQAGTPYIISCLRRIRMNNSGSGGMIGDPVIDPNNSMPPISCNGEAGFDGSEQFDTQLDNLFINLTNYNLITWNTNQYLQPQPAAFENIVHETNITNTDWQRTVQCFTPTNNWNTLCICTRNKTNVTT